MGVPQPLRIEVDQKTGTLVVADYGPAHRHRRRADGRSDVPDPVGPAFGTVGVSTIDRVDCSANPTCLDAAPDVATRMVAA
jgi:hypothetical protein